MTFWQFMHEHTLFVGIMLLAILGTVERVFNHWRNK